MAALYISTHTHTHTHTHSHTHTHTTYIYIYITIKLTFEPTGGCEWCALLTDAAVFGTNPWFVLDLTTWISAEYPNSFASSESMYDPKWLS